jgi:hypothetical protein
LPSIADALRRHIGPSPRDTAAMLEKRHAGIRRRTRRRCEDIPHLLRHFLRKTDRGRGVFRSMEQP